MKFQIALLPIIAAAGCAAPPKAPPAPLVTPRDPNSEVMRLNRGEAPAQTDAQKKAADEAAADFFLAMAKTISEIDDGTSGADAIGRAALAKNISLLRKKVEAQTAHFARTGPIGAMTTRELIDSLPRQQDFDNATGYVLTMRRKRADALR